MFPPGANLVTGQAQAGMWFGKTDDLFSQFGKPQGWGGPWRNQTVSAGQASDPYLMTGVVLAPPQPGVRRAVEELPMLCLSVCGLVLGVKGRAWLVRVGVRGRERVYSNHPRWILVA